VVRYSATVGAAPGDADIAPVRLVTDKAGILMDVRTPAGVLAVRSTLVGAHNVANLLAAIAVAHLLELDPVRVSQALCEPIVVPGRLERCDVPGTDNILVLVDYAHTPDALERALGSVRALGSGRVVCVFGCGGDRDPGKRPLMGAAAARGADIAFVTND